MGNFSILRPLNQQFIQYPYWIAQDSQFSYEEKGLLTNLLIFKDSFHKSALARFASNGKRSIERAWKGLIAKGILIAQRFKSNNRFDWSYTVNLEKISRIPKVDYAEIALRHGVSEAVARAILEETLPMPPFSASQSEIRVVKTQKGAISKPVLEIEPMPIPVMEIAKPVLEIEPMPISVMEIAKPVLEIEEMPIPVLEVAKQVLEIEKMPIPEIEPSPTLQTPTMGLAEMWIPIMDMDWMSNPFWFESASPLLPAIEIEKPVMVEAKSPISERVNLVWIEKTPLITMETAKPTLATEKMPIIHSATTPQSNAIPSQTASERHEQYALRLLQDTKLIDYLRLESPHFEVKPEILVAFQKRLEMNEIQHPTYEKYAQHFRNWLPDFLKYQQKGHSFQSVKKNWDAENPEKEEKCGSNKAFNILRKKLQNPQSDYMTYQSWVIELSEMTENLSSADIAYKKELLETQKAGKLKERYEHFKAKNAAAPVRGR
jgi:hypothetical protein